MTTGEKLHSLVDALSDAEAEAALTRLTRERELLREWAEADQREATEDAWALGNAREAIREEPLDNLRTVPRALLTQSITKLDQARVDELCRALPSATGC